MKSEGFLNIIFGLIVLCVIILAAIVLLQRKTKTSSLPVACTMEAKICSDGSYVSRSGPNCEFSACP